MKLETRKFIEGFISDNSFVERVIIYNKDKSFYFPESLPVESQYFETLFENIAGDQHGETHYAVITRNKSLVIIKEEKNIYICECVRDVSMSRLKMVFGTFVEDIKKQVKGKRFFKSIFDW